MSYQTPQPGTVLYRYSFYPVSEHTNFEALLSRHVFLGVETSPAGYEYAKMRQIPIGLRQGSVWYTLEISWDYFERWFRRVPNCWMLVLEGLGVPDELRHEVWLFLRR